LVSGCSVSREEDGDVFISAKNREEKIKGCHGFFLYSFNGVYHGGGGCW